MDRDRELCTKASPSRRPRSASWTSATSARILSSATFASSLSLGCENTVSNDRLTSNTGTTGMSSVTKSSTASKWNGAPRSARAGGRFSNQLVELRLRRSRATRGLARARQPRSRDRGELLPPHRSLTRFNTRALRVGASKRQVTPHRRRRDPRRDRPRAR